MKNDIHVILIGPQHVGKSTIGKLLAPLLGIPFLDSDTLILSRQESSIASIRELYTIQGKEGFHRLEAEVCLQINNPCIFATGGGLADNPLAVSHLSSYKPKVLLSSTSDIVWKRIITNGIPAYLMKYLHGAMKEKTVSTMTQEEMQSIQEIFHDIFTKRMEVYQEIADITINTVHKTPESIVQEIHTLLH